LIADPDFKSRDFFFGLNGLTESAGSNSFVGGQSTPSPWLTDGTVTAGILFLVQMFMQWLQ